MTAFASFAEYKEYIYRQANAAQTLEDVFDHHSERVERFVSEWLEICGQNETMYPITIERDGRMCVMVEIAVFSGCVRFCTYVLSDRGEPYEEEEQETARSCWIKISFLFKMMHQLSGEDEDRLVFETKREFCDAWAMLQFRNREPRQLEFHYTRAVDTGSNWRPESLIARDPGASLTTSDLLPHSGCYRVGLEPAAFALWSAGTAPRHQIERDSNGLFTLIHQK